MNLNRSIWLAGLAALILLLPACKSKEADMILVNGIIHTLDADSSIAQACAIKDGRIVAIGRSDELTFYYEADTIIDLEGKVAYPGLIDAHCHYHGYAMGLNKVNLVGTTSWEEVVALTEEFATRYSGEWIQGRGWDHTNWKDQDYPTKRLLDEKFPDRPVILRRIGGHSAIVNQVALDRAGITSSTKVKGGQILKNGSGPTGLLIDNAVDMVEAVIPKPSRKETIDALLEAEQRLFAVGLTTVDDAGLDLEVINLIDSLQQAGILNIRVYAMANPNQANFDRFLKNGPYKTPKMHVSAFKVYADGALGSRGACLLKPYKDQPGHYGFLLHEPQYYRDIAKKLYDAGFQMNTHCIGDSANRMILRIYGETLGGKNDRRWRIEHAQVVDTTDFYRFGEYNIWPSANPLHAISDHNWSEDRIGKLRLKGAYAYKTLLEQNGYIAFGSDFPVEDIHPLLGFHAAVARIDLEGNPYGGFMKGEAVSRLQALYAMTKWAAKSNFEEDVKGSLEPGKFADIVVFDEDLLSMEEKQIPYSRLRYTILDGKIVFSSGE